MVNFIYLYQDRKHHISILLDIIEFHRHVQYSSANRTSLVIAKIKLFIISESEEEKNNFWLKMFRNFNVDTSVYEIFFHADTNSFKIKAKR